MKISQQDLIKIVERASTISDRLGPRFTPNEIQDHNPIDARLEKWCRVVAKGNQEKFKKYLVWEGLDFSNIRNVLGTVRLADGESLPGWVETLKELMQAAFSLDSDKVGPVNHQVLNSEEPLPFEEILIPFLNVARKKLVTRTGSSYQLLLEAAHVQLERSLLEQLVTLCSSSLELEFSIFRSFRHSALDRLTRQLQGNISREQYMEFIKGLANGGLLPFFQEYSVLARLVATVTDYWVDAVEEFLLRLVLDWTKIQTTFQGKTELGQVAALKPSLSDSHDCGRAVIGIKFTSGLKLVYKPRDLSLEQAYFEFLDWSNAQGIPLPFKLLKVINCFTHGWVEFAEAFPCQNLQETKRFYQRVGILLCILYVLRGTDCHYENLIACGEQPVLIDMETLLHHRIGAAGADADAQNLANQWLQDSVIGTSLLPQWQISAEGQSYDLSGLSSIAEQEMLHYVLKWKHINTDSMELVREQIKVQPRANLPFEKGINAAPKDYIEDLVNGFYQMYNFLGQHKEALLATKGPLTVFSHQQVRFVFRATRIYYSILQQSLQPKYLRDGADRSIELSVLNRSFLSSDTKPPLWALLESERQALEQLDIPRFTAYSDSTALTISSEKFLTEASYNTVISRIQQLGNADLTQQISFIQGSLYSYTAIERHSRYLPESTELCLSMVIPLTQEAIVQQAVAIAQELQKRAIIAADGSATWFGMGYLPEAQRFQINPLDHHLYDGRCGVALFLAALAVITGNTEFGNLAIGAVRPLCQALQNQNFEFQQEIAEQIDIGGATGLGSIVYALVKIAKFLGKVELIQNAQQVTRLMLLKDTAVNQEYGIMSGAAGAILGLLALYKTTTDPAVLAQATTWGKYLLNSRVTTNVGSRAWATTDGKILTGFSNGTAGIAYALLCLYAATHDLSFLSAAEEAIAYEHSVFSWQFSNCSDCHMGTLNDSKPSFVTGWCHGTSGIGLACLGSLPILNTDDIHQQIEVALQITQKSGLLAVDNLCCGNFGHIEFLLVAALQLSRPEFLEIAQKQATWVVNRAEQFGSFRLLPNLPAELHHPGFFQGTSGIGYQLLRLAHPDLLPCVLLWQ